MHLDASIDSTAGLAGLLEQSVEPMEPIQIDLALGQVPDRDLHAEPWAAREPTLVQSGSWSSRLSETRCMTDCAGQTVLKAEEFDVLVHRRSSGSHLHLAAAKRMVVLAILMPGPVMYETP